MLTPLNRLLETYWYPLPGLEKFWYIVGFTAQVMFSARFIVQWIASERKGESYIPISFWWLSAVGGGMLLAYAIYRREPVFILGQLPGQVVYMRNLILIHRKREKEPGPGVLPLPANSDLRKAG
jgi:lipid-A-disaccharide synthase-like uncharacterized protein